MERALTLYQSTIGKKAIMAVSGMVLFGFVFGHLLGNLNLYRGPEAINSYAAFLHGTPALLWGTRIVVLLAVLAHVGSSFQLVSRNAAARPQGYRRKKDLATTYAARTMAFSGPILLFYLLYHLAHLTYGMTAGTYEFARQDVYNNVVLGFQQWWISAIYIVGNLALGIHLYHGAWSLFQTLGASHPRYDRLKEMVAMGVVAFIVVGNLSFPILVLAGLVQPSSPFISFE